MRYMNTVLLIGNVTKEPVIRDTSSGKKVASLTLATSTSWNDTKTRESKEYTEFHNIVAWGKLAEICEELVHKGTKLYINGSLTTTSWDDDLCGRRYMTQVRADELVVLSNKKKEQEVIDDDLPFN